MRQSWTYLLFLILLTGLTLGAFAIRTLPAPEQTPETEVAAAPIVTEPSIDFANPSKGPADATVTIVEYGDFLCESCGLMRSALAQVMEEHRDKVRVVWKDFPNVEAHPGTDVAAVAARCAQQQGAFWQYHDLLLEGGAATANDASYRTFARALGLDEQAFSACLDTRDTLAMVDRDFIEGQLLQVDATPYFFVNGQRYGSITTYENLARIVQGAFSEAAR